MKKIVLCAFALISTMSFAQLSNVKNELSKATIAKKDTVDGWRKNGNISLAVSQSAFSNWVAGGDNNIAGNIGVNYNFNYTKGPWTWDNMIILGYGLAKRNGDEVKKTNDQIALNSIVGRKAFENWSYSFFLNFRTQFTDGYDYGKSNYKDYPTSGLFKPAYLTFGPGLLWRKSDNLNFNFAPVTSKVTFLSGEVWTHAPKNNNANANGYVSSNDVMTYGVEPGKSTRYELGFYASGYYKTNLMENVSMENILSLYSNYLDNPKNIDIDYTTNIVMQINKYLSTNLTVQLLYDDNAKKALQVREVFGLGVNLNF